MEENVMNTLVMTINGNISFEIFGLTETICDLSRDEFEQDVVVRADDLSREIYLQLKALKGQEISSMSVTCDGKEVWNRDIYKVMRRFAFDINRNSVVEYHMHFTDR